MIRALWVLIVPFGFANVAYWSVDLEEPTGRRSSAGGGLVRLFGLVLTLLWVSTAATLTLWVLAAQCYGPRTALPGGGAYVMTCTALPGWLVLMPRRHVTAIADLTDDEARALGT